MLSSHFKLKVLSGLWFSNFFFFFKNSPMKLNGSFLILDQAFFIKKIEKLVKLFSQKITRTAL